MRFVYVGSNAYVALSEVVRAESDGGSMMRLTLRSGDVERVTEHEWNQATELSFSVAFASPPGYFMLERLTEDDGSETTHKEPVLGWAVGIHGQATPVTAQGVNTDRNSVLVPDGRVVEFDGWQDDVANWERNQSR